MINKTTESTISEVIDSKIPEIEMHRFRPPAKFDGGHVSQFGFFNTETGNAIRSFQAREGYVMTTRDDYKALATAAFDAMDGNGTIKAFWTESKSHASANIIVEPTKDQQRQGVQIQGNDYIFPRLIIRAPFGRPFQITGGFYRHLCENLDIPRALPGHVSVNLRHTSQLREQMDTLIELCGQACDFDGMLASIRRLNETQANIVETLNRLYPQPEDTGAALTRHRNRAENIVQRIHNEHLRANNATLEGDTVPMWNIVQAVTGYVQHDKTRRGNVDAVERAVLGLNDSENHDVWKLAAEMLAS